MHCCCCAISPGQLVREGGGGPPSSSQLQVDRATFRLRVHLLSSLGCFHLKAHNRCDLCDPQAPTLMMSISIRAHLLLIGRLIALNHPAHTSPCRPSQQKQCRSVCSCMLSPHPLLCPLCLSAYWALLHPSAARLCVAAAL